MAKLTTCAALVACLLLACASCARADLKGACDDSSNWSLRNDATVPGTYSDMSGCQVSVLKLSSANKIILGGKGSADIIGIPAGGDSGGCTDPGRQCMSWCQALCCITKGCTMAHIYNKEETQDYVVYKEKVNKYYCTLWATGSYKSSSNQVTCAMKNNANCPALMMQNFKVNSTTYQYLIFNNANSQCQMPPSGRRLASTGLNYAQLAKDGIKGLPIPSSAELNTKLANLRINKDLLKQRINNGTTGIKQACTAMEQKMLQRCPK